MGGWGVFFRVDHALNASVDIGRIDLGSVAGEGWRGRAGRVLVAKAVCRGDPNPTTHPYVRAGLTQLHVTMCS